MPAYRSIGLPRTSAGRLRAGLAPLWVLTVLLVTVTVVPAASSDEQCDGRPVPECSGYSNIEDQINAATHPSIYKKLVRPPCGNSTHKGPTFVEVQFRLLQINEVDEKLGHLTISGYLRMWWTDPRLAFNDTANGGCFDRIDLPGEASSLLWKPDLYIDNLVAMRTDIGGASLMSISPDGSVWSSAQVVVTVKVAFELGQLPYDKHEIRMTVASYSQDTSNIRVFARGGRAGTGYSGIGLSSPMYKHAVWEYFDNFAQSDTEYETQGLVEGEYGWDFLHMIFHIQRKPKYYVDQVIYPSVVFLLISYSQFYVDAHAAPARATLAVIPVLIMRTMVNYVYRNLPEGSQHMWLADFLFVANLLVGLGAVEYAMVQYCLTLEKRRAKRREGLQKVTATARKLMQQAQDENITLMELVYQVTQQKTPVKKNSWCGKVIFGSAHGSSQVQPMPQTYQEQATGPPATFAGMREWLSSASKTASVELPREDNGEDDSEEPRMEPRASAKAPVKECELTFVFFALDVFDDYPGGKENKMTAYEFRLALVTFDIYMNVDQAARALCMAMRDMGQETPDDELTITLSFERFTRVLLVIDDYIMPSKDRRSLFQRWSLRSFLMAFQSQCPSKRIDIVARWVCPIIVALFFIVFYATLSSWDHKNE